MTAPLLDVRGLRKFFPIAKGMFRRVTGHVRAVDDVSFTVQEGEALGLVGESGCGKTTTARCILRAIDPTDGQVLYRTRDDTIVDLAPMSAAELGPLRKEIQMIFQDPFGSLNPRMTLFDNVGEPLLVNGMRSRRERMDRVAELLRLVGLRPEFMHRFPHAFSGGQRQRIGIARALATGPRLVVADEPVSALDVSVQAQVLNLLLELQSRLRLTFLFVAHDLSVVRHICDRVAVMYVGQLVELATDRCGVQPSAASLYRGADARGAGARSAGVGRRYDPEGRGAEPGVSAIGLLLPSALHVRRGAVPNGGAGAAGGDAGSLRAVSLRGGVGIGSGSRHIADHGVQLCEWGSQCRPGRPGFNVLSLRAEQSNRMANRASPLWRSRCEHCRGRFARIAMTGVAPGGALRHPAGIGGPDGLQAGRPRSARPGRRGREDDPDRLARHHAGDRRADDRRDARFRLVVPGLQHQGALSAGLGVFRQLELMVWAIPLLMIMLLGGVAWIGSHELDPAKPLPSKDSAARGPGRIARLEVAVHLPGPGCREREPAGRSRRRAACTSR